MAFGWVRDILLFKSDRTLSFLLVFLVLLLFVVYPFFDVEGAGRYFIDVTMGVVLVSGALVVEKRKLRLFAFALLVASLLTRWGTYFSPSRQLLFITTLLAVVFYAFSIGVILGRVFASGRVTGHRVQGAVAVYLLIGLVFGTLYALILQVNPDAFDMLAIDLTGTPRDVHERSMGRMVYFSFITLTTVGYGDISPIGDVAKQFVVLEGLIGQLYPAILLARLVSLQVSSPDG